MLEEKMFDQLTVWYERGEEIYGYHEAISYELIFLEGEAAWEQGHFEEAFAYFDQATRKFGKGVWGEEDPKYLEFYKSYEPADSKKDTGLRTSITPPFDGESAADNAGNGTDSDRGKSLPKKLDRQVKTLAHQAEAYAEHEAYPESLQAGLKALELLPKPKGQWQLAGEIYLGLADTLFNLEQFESAATAAQYALDCGLDTDPEPWKILGAAQPKQGNAEAARAAIAQAQKLGDEELLSGEETLLN